MSELGDIAEAIARRLIARGESVSVCEASAGGSISAVLLAVSGASAYYRGGVVVYTGASRERLLGITVEHMGTMRASTAPYAALLAQAVREKLGTTWAVAETGAAGPTGNRYGDAAGHAALAISGPVERTQVLETGDGDRRRNMEAFALGALRLLLEAIPAE